MLYQYITTSLIYKYHGICKKQLTDTHCLLANYTLVGPLTMGFLHHLADNQNISKSACNFMFLLLSNPSLVKGSS